MSRTTRLTVLAVSAVALTACQTMDLDLRRNFGNGFDTSDAVSVASAPRPRADDRGIISYPNYQVAVARRGDTLATLASRIGLSEAELAKYNGIPPGTSLNKDEIVALPRRVSEPSPATGALRTGPILPADQTVDIATLADGAIQRAEPAATGTITAAAPSRAQTGAEPVRHKVARGETAYSISRLYGVSIRSLADWNGLSSDLSVREGQFLLIPVASETPPSRTAAIASGTASAAPPPPSASKPLPAEKTAKAGAIPNNTPPSPKLDQFKSAASSAGGQMTAPVAGAIIRDFKKGKSEGIDLSAAAGTAVKAAADGTVAAITRDTNQVPIVVLRHDGGLLTVYAQVDNLKIKKGDTVKRGQTIAEVRAGDPTFVHFEVRKGLEAVDPTPYLNP